MKNKLLSADKVHFQIGNKALVNQVSLELFSGSFTAVLGRNGAGKSSLLKLLTGDVKPSSGSVEVFGRDLQSYHPRDLAKHRAVLTQNTQLNFDFEVMDVVLLGRAPHQRGNQSLREDHDVAWFCLKMAGLEDFAERKYLSLSGGEQQRVQFARAMAQIYSAPTGQAIFFLDEPTASLDIYHQHHILDSVAKFCRERNFAVFAILHDINLAARYADHIVILDQGALAAAGPTDQVLTADTLKNAFKYPLIVTNHPELGHKLIISC